MRVIRAVVPALVIGVFVLLAALPWGLPQDVRLLAPLMPLTGIHYWAVRRDARLPMWCAFLAGLLLDILLLGPLGYWAFIFVVGYSASWLLSAWCPDWKSARWAAFVLVAGVSAGVAWGLASLYYFDAADWRGFLYSALSVSVLYPLAAAVLGAADGIGRERAESAADIEVSHP